MSTTSSSLPPPPPNPRFDTLSSHSPLGPPPSSSRHHRTDSQNGAAPIQDALSRDFPEVASLSREDMQLLLEDPDYFTAFFHSRIPEAIELDQAVSQQIEQNLDLAQKSQDLKPELDELRRETRELFEQARQLEGRSHYLAEAQTDTFRKFSHDAQLNRYRAAATMQDHLCESMLQSLLDGQFPAEALDEQFIKQYKEVRKVYHKRSIGLRKWEEGKVVWET